VVFGVILDLNELKVGLDRIVSGREFKVWIVEGKNDFMHKCVLFGTGVKSSVCLRLCVLCWVGVRRFER
jgi:hypothetical protein